MSRYVYEGKTRVDYAPTIADISAPTVAEIGAGTRVSTFMAKDGLSTPQNQNMVDSATIEDTFDAQGVGSWGGQITLMLFRDDTADDAWDLIVYGLEGFLVIRRGLDADTAYAATQDVEVWPVEAHEPIVQNSASNEQVRFASAWAVTDQPDQRAVVAA